MLYNTLTTNRNGGNHAPHQTKKAWKWIDECSRTYDSPRLYHIALCNLPDFAGWRSYQTQKSILKDLMQHLRRQGMKASYKAAREIDNGRGEHTHAFICVEAAHYNPCHTINKKFGGWLYQYAHKRGIDVYINPPRHEMHGGQNFMTLPVSKPEKIADAKERISYLHKKRDKPTCGEIYSSSRPPKQASTVH